MQRGPEESNFEESPKIYSADELEKMKPEKKDKKEQAEKKAKNKVVSIEREPFYLKQIAEPDS